VTDRFLLVFFLMLFLDLLLIAVRTSLGQARLPHLINLQSQKASGVERTLNLLERPYLPVTLRLSVTLVEMFLAGLVWWGLQILTLEPPGSALVIVGLVLVVLLILGMEFLVERLILKNPEAWAIRFSLLGSWVDTVLRPLAWVLVQLRGKTAAVGHRMDSVTEDELRKWVEGGQTEVKLEKGERKMIYSIFHFSDTLCREIMVPRIDVFGLEVNIPLPEAVQAMIKASHSRVPVFEETIDNVCGILYAKDLLKVRLDEQIDTIRSLMRPVHFVPEAKKVDELLHEMQARGVHIAIVVDEFGGMAGMVTLEDIMEEIVGEIRDEYDQSEELLCQQVGKDEFIFQGRIDLDDLNEVLGTHLTKEDADTLGGFIYAEIGRVPVGGEQVVVEDWLLTIAQVSGRRIRAVRAARYTPLSEKEE